MMSVGPFVLLIQPLWQTLDQKELFNKLQGSVCADHGMRYTGWQLRVNLASTQRRHCTNLNMSLHTHSTELCQVEGI